DAGAVEAGQIRGERAHAVLAATHGDMTVLLRRAVTARGAPWVQPVQHLLRLVGPFPRTAVLQVGQVGGGDLVDLGALRGPGRRPPAPAGARRRGRRRGRVARGPDRRAFPAWNGPGGGCWPSTAPRRRPTASAPSTPPNARSSAPPAGSPHACDSPP